MAKTRTKYVCQQCDSHYPTAYGRCPQCNAWGSLVEVVERVAEPARGLSPAMHQAGLGATPRPLVHIDSQSWQRLPLPGSAEFSRVLGGGIVPGSLVLVGGDPGIGKSTLLLQVCSDLAALGIVLYVSGEESAEQVKMRADRLGPIPPQLYILAETDLDAIMAAIDTLTPRLVIIDSIQTMNAADLTGSAGSVGQVRECTARLMRQAKQNHIPVVLVGHVTKEGTLAGPRVLEHIVDTVLYLEGDRFHTYRLLRSVKNRYGSTDEVGVFEMTELGMHDVANPSAAFLAERGVAAPGSSIVVTMEGSRPLLVEVQALVSQTGFSLPRRTSTGFDVNRLYILLAVLTKRVGLPLGTYDVYCNVVGGLRINEPAADLGIALAVVSSLTDVPVAPDLAAFGEVGLSGEIRAVGQIAGRLNEAAKLGFRRCMVPASGLRGVVPPAGMTVVSVSTVREALREIMTSAGSSMPAPHTPPPAARGRNTLVERDDLDVDVDVDDNEME